MTIELQLDSNARWRRRFQSAFLFYSQVAFASPSHGLVVAKLDGDTFQLYAWNTVTNELQKRTDGARSVYFGWIAPDGKTIFYLKDSDGSEKGYLAQVDYETGVETNITPELPPFTLRGFNISKSGNAVVFNAVTDAGFHYYHMQRDGETSSPPRLLFSQEAEIWDAHLSYNGDLLAVKSTARAGGRRDYSTVVFDMNGQQVAELWDGEGVSVEPMMFSPVADDTRLLATTTVSGVNRPIIYNITTNERRDLPNLQLSGIIEPLDWSRDGQRILLRQTYQAQTHLHIYDLENEVTHALAHPVGTISGKRGVFTGGLAATYFSPNNAIWAQWTNSATPATLLELDNASGQQRKTKLSISDAPAGQPERSITFASTDGTPVQGWLSVPSGEPPFPTIINLHGGPHDHVMTGFDPFGQVWVDHGFAHFSINYRGSTGFGQAFQQQIVGDVGHWELEDMIAARDWLIEEGIAMPNEVVLSGGSYGGYLVVLALVRQPQLWRAGIASAAVVDWAINYADCGEATKGLTRSLFGGTPDELPTQYKAASPIHNARKLSSPLLIFQAENDSRATLRQMRQFQAKTTEQLHKPVQFSWLGSGHDMGSVTMFQAQLVEKLQFIRDIFAS